MWDSQVSEIYIYLQHQLQCIHTTPIQTSPAIVWYSSKIYDMILLWSQKSGWQQAEDEVVKECKVEDYALQG